MPSLIYWSRVAGHVNTLSFEVLAHEPGSPGRVFVLDENHLVDRLSALEAATAGRYRWSETAGLKQLIREQALSDEEALDFVAKDYPPPAGRGTA